MLQLDTAAVQPRVQHTLSFARTPSAFALPWANTSSLYHPLQKNDTKQLSLLGLDCASDDPFLSDKFIDDLTLWPPVEYGNIFCYLIERLGVYTQEQLLQWKSIDTYNYFISGHVREVKIWAPSNSQCILRAEVNPSQKSSDSCHFSWRAMDKLLLHTVLAWLGTL